MGNWKKNSHVLLPLNIRILLPRPVESTPLDYLILQLADDRAWDFLPSFSMPVFDFCPEFLHISK